MSLLKRKTMDFTQKSLLLRSFRDVGTYFTNTAMTHSNSKGQINFVRSGETTHNSQCLSIFRVFNTKVVV
jgi:hypothetical protein